jgi:hypothetical protein
MSAGKAEVDERGQSIDSTRGKWMNVTKWRQHTEHVKMSVDRMGAAHILDSTTRVLEHAHRSCSVPPNESDIPSRDSVAKNESARSGPLSRPSGTGPLKETRVMTTLLHQQEP